MSKSKLYYARLKKSLCRGKGPVKCKKTTRCKKTNKNIRRSYCRSRKNRHL